MIEYRTFCNSDPARIVALWNGCPLGRGAATGVSVDAFETLNFAQPYFDRHGLIVACDNGEIIGFLHAGFGANEDESALSYDAGVICAVLVHPSHRRQGIGRELLTRGEAYLREKGAPDDLCRPERTARSLFLWALRGEQPQRIFGIGRRGGPVFGGGRLRTG